MGIETMKKIAVYVFMAQFLAGCDTLTIFDDVTENELEQTISAKENDEYYLQIAKDLYVAKQYKQTYQIAVKLAEKDNYEAQYLLGYLIYYGQGVPADPKEGAKWIQKAADAGHRPAIEGLVMIQHGLTPDNKCETDNKAKSNTEAPEIKQEGQIIITPNGQKEYTRQSTK